VGTKEFPVTWNNERPENSQRIFSGELLYRSYRLVSVDTQIWQEPDQTVPGRSDRVLGVV
jgi:hypothetical protein